MTKFDIDGRTAAKAGFYGAAGVLLFKSILFCVLVAIGLVAVLAVVF